MATYLTLNFIVLSTLCIVLFIFSVNMNLKRMGILLLITTLFTAVFDTLIIQAGIVAYESSKILGVYIGKAPMEDFAYTVAAALLVPYVWERLKSK